MTPSELSLAAGHWAEDAGILLALGCFVVRRLGRMPPRIVWAQPSIANAMALATVGGVVLLVLSPGWLLLVRVGVEGAGWLLCVRGRPFVAPFAVVAAAMVSVSGHAATSFPAAGAEFADILHFLAAGMWAGGILALVTLRPPGGWASGEARGLVERFGRVAVIAFGVTALTGVLRATEQLSAMSDLWTTTYGVVLAMKIAGVAVVLGLTVLWRRGARVQTLDAVVVSAIVLLTGLLAALPPAVN